MPVYAYKGVTSAGKSTRGQLSADNLRAARLRMRQDGIFLTEIGETNTQAAASGDETISGRSRFNPSFTLGRRIPGLERSVATRQLATLTAAGIPLVEAMSALVEQIEHSYLKSVMAQARDRVNEGASLADALQETGEFDNLYVSMIHAGEASGNLDTVLRRISDYLEEQVRLQGKISSILMYPAFMLVFTGLVIVALVTWVLPQITGLLISLDQDLPFYTDWIIRGSAFAREWWWAILIAAIGAFSGFRVAIKTDRGRSAWDRTKLRLPYVGKIVRVVSIARFSRTLATLLTAGVGIVQSLEIARYVTNNAVMSEVIDGARTAILEGAALAVPLKASGEFPPMVTTMIEVGERSGELEAMLDKVANTYDEQVEQTVAKLTSLIEPILILVMVGIVLVIILATLMPLLQITSSLG
ncbi:MAG: type II secretion system inner membrane protein GspF [Myxococcota bacterium]